MKILKLLNKILLFKILFSFLLFTNLFSNEPVDIWSINNNSNNENSIEQNNLEEPEGDSLIIQTLNNQSTTSIELDNKINVDEKNYLVGLFDPAEHDLTLNMWQLSDGEKILNIIEKLNKLNLSNDAKDLYNKLILTNALPPKNNLTIDEFLKLKTNWLIRVNDLNLIKEFILKNSEKIDQDLVKYYLEQNLSNNNLNDACQILSNLESFDEDKYFGKLLEKEVKAVQKVMDTGQKPVLAILGGAKVSSKITIIENILDKIDHLIIGGGMVYTFVKAMGGNIGQSICEDEYFDFALELLEKAKLKNVNIHLPTDVIIADDFSNKANKKVCMVSEIPEDWQGLDAGPKTLKAFENMSGIYLVFRGRTHRRCWRRASALASVLFLLLLL